MNEGTPSVSEYNKPIDWSAEGPTAKLYIYLFYTHTHTYIHTYILVHTYIHTYTPAHIHMSHVGQMSTIKTVQLPTVHILQTTSPLVAEPESSTPLIAESATGYFSCPSNVFYILLKKCPNPKPCKYFKGVVFSGLK
jgi:hypothetical protein